MARIQKVGIGLMELQGLDVYSFNNEVEIARLKGKKLNYNLPDVSIPGRVSAISMVLTLAGEANIEIDGKPYTLFPGTVMDLTGIQVFRNFLFSDDYEGYNFMVSTRFYDEIFHNEKHMTPEAAMKKSTDPLDRTTPEEMTLLVNILKRIIWNIGRSGHIWQRRMVMNEVRSFFMEAGNITVNHLTVAGQERNISDNDLVFFKFMRLLQDNCNERRPVKFYADRLCLTPDHFAKTIKAYTGRNATDWINETLLRQAKLYLGDPEMSVQQVADMINFSDQSAFGKFFKKQTGMSPGEYRKEKQ